MAINFPNSPNIGDTHFSADTTWEWDGTACNIVASGAQLGVIKTINADVGSKTATTNNDSITIAGGTSIATNIANDTLTINYTGTGGGDAVLQNLFESFSDGTDTASPNTPNDTFNFAAGTDISLSLDDQTNTLTINSTASGGGGGGGATNFTDLTDVSTASINVAEIYEPAVAMYRVGAVGTSAYTFGDHYSGNNPGLYVITGTTIAFDLSNIAGHPFQIQNSQGDAYNTGLVHVSSTGTVSTGINANGQQSGVLYWRVPYDISGTYRYQCIAHAAMFGSITIKRINLI